MQNSFGRKFRVFLTSETIFLSIVFCCYGDIVHSSTTEIKYVLSDLGDTQKQKLWSDIEKYAIFEHALNVCGKKSNVEQRVKESVRDCVNPDAIKSVTDYWFLRLKEEEKSTSHPNFDKNAYCNSQDIIRLSTKYLRVVDETVAALAQSCQSCVKSGLCR